MNCESCREVLSAALDGEATMAELTAASAHRRGCPACESYAVEIDALHRTVRLQPAEAVPDLTSAILAAHPVPGVAPNDDVVVWRLGLAFVAAAQIVAAVAHLGGAHVVRDQAAWEAALAAGFAWAAWRPQRSVGFVPVALVLSILLLVNGGVAPGAGAHHLLAPIGTVFLVLATRRPGARRAVVA